MRLAGLEPATGVFVSLLIVAVLCAYLHVAIQQIASVCKHFVAFRCNREQEILCANVRPETCCAELCGMPCSVRICARAPGSVANQGAGRTSPGQVVTRTQGGGVWTAPRQWSREGFSFWPDRPHGGWAGAGGMSSGQECPREIQSTLQGRVSASAVLILAANQRAPQRSRVSEEAHSGSACRPWGV